MDLQKLRTTIVTSVPELENSSFTLLTAGWDYLAVDVDDRLIFRFPRESAAEKSLMREARLLAVIRPGLSLPVPDLSLHAGPPLFSQHTKLPGDHLVTAQYERLPAEARRLLATDLARFYIELHHPGIETLQEAGAGPVHPWLPPEEILRRTREVLPPRLGRYAERAVSVWQDLPPDPYGTTYGFFDGHGWNMAFDHDRERLNGIYDFGDSGFGPLHQEFIYSNFISADLTSRIVVEYEALSGLKLDRERIDLLTGILRLSELAEQVDDSALRPRLIEYVADWAAQHGL